MSDETQRFKKMIEDSQDWFWEFDENANFTYASPRIRDLLGYEPEELIGKNAFDLMAADEAERVRRYFDPIIQKHLPFKHLININTHKDGHKVVIESSGTPIFDNEGRFCGYLGIDRDITNRKRVEEELRQSEATFRKLFSASSDAILLIDSAGVFVECNQAALDLLKMTRQQFLLSPPARISPEFQPDGRRSAESAPEMIALAHSKGLHRFDWTCVNAEGGEFIVEVSLMPIVIKGQTMLHTTWRDITERKRIEEELQSSKEKLNDIVTLLPQSIFEADYGGRLTFANQAAFDLFGYSPGDFSAGLNVLNMVIPEDVERARENIGKLYMEEKDGSQEYTARRKDGSTFPVMIYSSVVKKEESPVGLRGIIVDISKRKKYEEELEKARDMAESMSAAKDEFLANMSHELRTPITAILGFAELLQGTELSEQQQKYLSTIASSTETLLALVNDLLDLAKIEAGKVYLEREEFSLRKLIGELADSQKAAAKAKNLSFKTRISAEVPDRLLGDPLRLKQILLNLTVNAIKFSEVGEVCLSVGVEDFHPSTPLLRFDVADTGIGINPERIADIFEPFSQLDPSFTRKFGGAGLGLAICTKLLAIMGGEISVDSRQDVGSTFHVLLPFEVVEIKTTGEGAHPARQTTEPEGVRLRVLLVEDHEISQYFFAEVLKRYGHQVDLAANGAEALGKIQCCNYDLVLMDVQMPVMDGLEAIGRIREMEEAGGGHLPVIALTAHAMEKDRIEVLSRGFDGYVSKPMKINELLDEIKRCLSLVQ
jgi:PAS domain S-box-containing protein